MIIFTQRKLTIDLRVLERSILYKQNHHQRFPCFVFVFTLYSDVVLYTKSDVE